MTDRELFIAALEHSNPAEREAWLADACGGDVVRRRRVDLLLRAHEQASKFLVAPAARQLARSPDDPTGTDYPSIEAVPATSVDVRTLLAPCDKPGLLGTLDHYEILEIVGTGGMGIVLKAFDPTLHRLVAIKLLAPHLAAHAAARQRFGREARANAAVRNEHVVAIHSVRAEGSSPYLVMEFVGGISLQDRLERSGALGVKEILRIGAQAARGLAAAHGQGLVHRDVKPANILLENGVERVRLTDFGLARTADDASLTRSGVIIGTPNYMSPEQAAGEPTDARSDLFSLGSVLYAVCTGHPPFRAETPLAVLRRVADDPPRPIREINPDVPDWLAEIVHKLLAKNPADRFQSAGDVADLLGRHLAHLQQPDAVPMPERVGRPGASRAPTIVRVQATERGQVVSWSEFKRGRLAKPGRLARLLSWTTMLTDVVTDLVGFAKSIDRNYRLVIVTPNGPTTASFDLMLAGNDFEIICSRRLVRGGFPFNPFAAEFGSNYDVIVSMNQASVDVRSKVLEHLQSKYQCTALDGTVDAEFEPGPVAVKAASGDAASPGERTWTQIFEATDSRQWWAQRILVLLGMLLIVWDVNAVIQAHVADELGPEIGGRFNFIGPGPGPLRMPLFVFAGLVGLTLMVVGGFVAKQRWQIPYKGRTLRLENSLYANERLFVDSVRIARGLLVLGNPREIRGTVPAGPGAGDEILAKVRRGIGYLRCELYTRPGPGQSPYVAESEPASVSGQPLRSRWHPGLDGRTAFAIGFGFFILLAGIFTAGYIESFATSQEQKVDALKWILGPSVLLALVLFGPGVFVARRWWGKRQPSDR